MKRAYTVELRSGPIESADALDPFAEQLHADRRVAGAVASADLALRVLEMRAGVDAESPTAALELAIAAFTRAARAAHVRDVDVVDAAVWIDDGTEHDRHELLSGTDIAERIGMSKQRVAQLVAEKGRFPRPAASFGTVSVWRWGDVADWIRAGGRGDTYRMTADAAAFAFSLAGARDTTRNPEMRAAMLERLIALANSGDKVAAAYLEKIPEEAFFDRIWIRQVDSGRGPGIAAGGTRIIRTRR